MNGILLNQTIDLTKGNVLNVLGALQDSEIQKLLGLESNGKVASQDFVNQQVATKADKNTVESLQSEIAALKKSQITVATNGDLSYESVTK